MTPTTITLIILGSLLVLAGVAYLVIAHSVKTFNDAFQSLEEENERWWGI